MEKLNDIVKKSNPTLWEKFDYCTLDFLEVAEGELEDKEFYSSRVKDLDVEYTESYMVFFVLARLKCFAYQYQPIEKVLYVIPFKYKDHYCFFSMEKFGLKFAITTNNEEIILQLFKKINSAIKIANRLLSPVIESTINNGEFTLENKSGVLRRRYLYFRNNVQLCLDFDHEKPGDDISAIVALMSSRSKKEWEVLFNTQAMLDAYFSFQEHILILLLPFSQFNKDEDNITNLIGSDWTTKFNRIFEPQQNSTLMKYYDNLRGIKELRNKYAHGGFEKKKGSLLAHVPTIGAIPVELPQREGKERVYSMIPIHDINFTEICKVFDEFDLYLRTSKWSRAIQIFEAGIDIRFDWEFIEQLNIATQSEENLHSFLELESKIYDRNANMDW